MIKISNFFSLFAISELFTSKSSGYITMGEFKEQCHRLHLGLLAHETEKLFNAICKSEDKQGNKATEDLGARGQIKGFSYRQFVRTFYKFRNVAMAVTR